MRHTNFIKRNSSFQIVNSSNDSFTLYKYSLASGISILPTPTISVSDEYFFTTIPTVDEDYFLFVVWDDVIEILRVGDPDVLVICYTGLTGAPSAFKHHSYNGELLQQGNTTEIGYGFYYIQPISLVKSFFNIEGNLISLVTPYKIINCVDAPITDGIYGDELFLNTGFATFGFAGEKHSYFDLTLGAWVDDVNHVAKAADLAKAVAHTYNLEWSDMTSPNHIYNYIKYFRTYDENNNVFRIYAPSITPENNLGNFDLISEDELGNMFIKGVSMLLVKDLVVVDPMTTGVTIPFR